MNGPQCKIIADSVSPDGVRLTTFELRIHRFTLAEWNTHRAFSRNSASSRAIPIEKTLVALQNSEGRAMPLEWPREQPGMSGGSSLDESDLFEAQDVLADIAAYTWTRIREYVMAHPDKATRLHKSLLNRPLEWFSWHTIVVTSTDWDNFFRQRLEGAQPEFMFPARLIFDALAENKPNIVVLGDWHMPYVDHERDGDLDIRDQLKVSAARCARTSYLTHDGKHSHEADLRLYDETLSKFGHWSPLEHQARCGNPGINFAAGAHRGNFRWPWFQQRQFVEDSAAERAWL